MTYTPVVIGDSVPWKIELLRIATRLERRKVQKRWTDQTNFLVERDIMVAAFGIRRLIEAHKLSGDVTDREVVVIQHALSDRVPDYMSHERIWQNYDLGAGTECVLTLGEFCNQIIHSFNWAVVCHEDGGLEGVFFSSDRARRKVLYFACIDLIVLLLREVGYDDVVSMSMTREGNGDWRVLSLLGADTRTARYEWLMTGHGRASRPTDST
jgi:hypothetical protein